jgi:hypothetical protein
MLKKPNAFCPVPKCETTVPHTNDPIVADLMKILSAPKDLPYWSWRSMVDLRNSVLNDMGEGRLFAWQTRLRQVEEIYFRALYCAFFAAKDELPHIFAGARPNSLTHLYRKVNDEILKGNGQWELTRPGQASGLSILHSAAHASFAAMLTAISCEHQPEQQMQEMRDNFIKHLNTYCDRLEYMQQLFAAGREKRVVMDAFILLHRTVRPE